MSGPRVSSGTESKQDYATPDDFMETVVKRFGPISFDLAAHAGNKKHARYFAPTEFVEVGTQEELGIRVRSFIGGQPARNDLPPGVTETKKKSKKGILYERRTPNIDPEAYGMDAFKHSWADLSKKFGKEHPSGSALLWLNCEFSDIDPWATNCLAEMKQGMNGALLTPLTTTNWYRDQHRRASRHLPTRWAPLLRRQERLPKGLPAVALPCGSDGKDEVVGLAKGRHPSNVVADVVKKIEILWTAEEANKIEKYARSKGLKTSQVIHRVIGESTDGDQRKSSEKKSHNHRIKDSTTARGSRRQEPPAFERAHQEHRSRVR